MQNYFENAKFSNILDIPNQLNDIEFYNCTFINIDFLEKKLNSVKFLECHFKNSNLSNCSIANCNIRDTKFENCKLLGINWSAVKSVFNLHISESILDYSIFHNLKMNYSTFTECSIKNAEFEESNLEGTVFYNTNLAESVFNRCNLKNCDMREAHNYFIDIKNNNVKDIKVSLPEAITLLTGIDIIVE